MSLFTLACLDPCPSPFVVGEASRVQVGSLVLERSVLDAGVCGPAFVTGVDLDLDGRDEAVVSRFGRMRAPSVPNGALVRYDADGRRQTILGEEAGFKWPNGSSPHDMDGDGDLDLVVGFGFLTCQLDPFTADCGALVWLENPDWTVHTLVEPGASGFYHHAAFADLNADGHKDLIAAQESQVSPFGHSASSVVEVFYGPDLLGQDLVDGLGSFVHAVDVDLDGDLDLMGASFFHALGQGSGQGYSWVEQDQDWLTHPIDTESGPAIQLTPVDLDGLAAIGSNHVGADDGYQPTLALYRPGEDPTLPWSQEILSDEFTAPEGVGAGAPGVFAVGDLDDDGDIDVVVSGDGDPDIHWVEQTDTGWTRHTLDTDLPQSGVELADMDGDGQLEVLVSSWEKNVVLRYTPVIP